MSDKRFYGVVCSLVKGKKVNCYVVGGVVCKVELVQNLFRFVNFPACFSKIDLAKGTGY